MTGEPDTSTLWCGVLSVPVCCSWGHVPGTHQWDQCWPLSSWYWGCLWDTGKGLSKYEILRFNNCCDVGICLYFDSKPGIFYVQYSTNRHFQSGFLHCGALTLFIVSIEVISRHGTITFFLGWKSDGFKTTKTFVIPFLRYAQFFLRVVKDGKCRTPSVLCC